MCSPLLYNNIWKFYMNKLRQLITYSYSNYGITQRMYNHFEKRTREHIDRVNKNARIISDFLNIYDSAFNTEFFLSNVKNHDSSKFYSYIYPGYVWINAFYNLKMEYPSENIKKLAEYSSKKHYTLENHHPEHHISPTNMNIYNLSEMVCDWHAMSQEYGTSTKEWFHNKALKKYSFDESQKEFLDNIISKLDTYSS